jgi:hypothetical protein
LVLLIGADSKVIRVVIESVTVDVVYHVPVRDAVFTQAVDDSGATIGLPNTQTLA